MNKLKFFKAVFKIFFGLLILLAVIVQYSNDSQKPFFSSINFFSYFTIESNIIIGVVFLTSTWFLIQNQSSKVLELVRGGSVLYMLTTGIVYYILLYNLPDPNRIVWVNTILHLIAPIVGLFDWIVNPPKQNISFKESLLWLIFPLVYVGYSLTRGLVTNWYPYSFLNPFGPGGIQTVVIYTVVISLGVIVGGFLLSKIGKLARKFW